MAKLIGTNPNQVPTNADLGSMAYQDANNAKIGGLAYPSSDGTNGQVLTTNGSGTLSFADAGGGAWEIVNTTTISGTPTNVDVTGLNNYSTYKIIVKNLSVAGASDVVWMRLLDSSGSIINVTAYDTMGMYVDTGNAPTSMNVTSLNRFYLTGYNNIYEYTVGNQSYFNAEINLNNFGEQNYKTGNANLYFKSGSAVSDFVTMNVGLFLRNNTRAYGFRLLVDNPSAYFNSGTIYTLGLTGS